MKTIKRTGFIAVFFFACTAFNAAAQENTKNVKEDTTGGQFLMGEVVPEFPGGDEARVKFLQENLVYPLKAREQGIEGKVWIGFVVETDGSLSNFTIVKGIDPILDNEALRVAKLMPKWIPGKERGKNVRVSFNLPITFSLNKKDKKIK
jgi:protein TonB